MALLQIAEPGQSAVPHEHKLAVGIDLGTTNSLVASVKSGQAQTLNDADNRFSMPSVVSYGSEKKVGYSALELAVSDPENTIISVKRFMGRSLEDISKTYPNLPYQFRKTEQGLPVIATTQGDKNAIEVSADILTPLRQLAEQRLGGELTGAVITVPAYFDDAQRAATKEAAKLAGLTVLRLLNEPTAAAVAYGLDSKAEGNIAVYDLGGGTFDISILSLQNGVFEVKATGGDTALGGDDFDAVIVEHLKQLWQLSELSHSDERTLELEAKRVKESLSYQDAVTASVTLANSQYQTELTNEQVNQLFMPLVKKTLRSVKRALRDSDFTIDEISDVVMVGGSTRIPLVRNQIENLFGKAPHTDIDPDKVVAIGAAIQADILAGNKPDSDLLLLDVLPLSLGIETMGGLSEKVISRNTTIPIARAQEFTTFKDGQTAMAIHVVQGERELTQDCRSLAKFELRGIPPMAAGTAVIRITFQVDADGLLSVTAMEKTSGVQASIEVKPSFGLSDDEISNMLKASMENAEQDIVKRMLLEQRVEAQRVIESLSAALQEDGHLLEPQSVSELSQSIEQLKLIAQADDGQAIKDAIDALDKQSTDFAALRMENSIKQALSGQNVDKI